MALKYRDNKVNEDKVKFLRDDVLTYKKKYFMLCLPTTYEVLRFKNSDRNELIVTKTKEK